jgi:hypothetical protein
MATTGEIATPIGETSGSDNVNELTWNYAYQRGRSDIKHSELTAEHSSNSSPVELNPKDVNRSSLDTSLSIEQDRYRPSCRARPASCSKPPDSDSWDKSISQYRIDIADLRFSSDATEPH